MSWLKTPGVLKIKYIVKSSQIIVFNNKSSLNVYNTYESTQYRMMY